MTRAGSVLVVAALIGCGWSGPRLGLTEQDQAFLSTMVLRGAPADPTNEFLEDDAVAIFGQQLFFDRGLSNVPTDGGFAFATDGISCAECHSPSSWFSDERPARNLSQGLTWTKRNSPTVVNVGFYEWFGWDGRADTLWGQGVHAYQSGATMGGSQLRLARVLQHFYGDRYRTVFKEPLPPELDANHPFAARFEPRSGQPLAAADQRVLKTIYERALKAMAAYMSRLSSVDSPFDRFVLGDDRALDDSQRRGLVLFIGRAGCIECHRGPMLSDNLFHSIGVGQQGPNVPKDDLGRFTGLTELENLVFRRATDVIAPTERDKGKFRTKGLRTVAETAPYMHAGQLGTLEDVVWFYNRGGDRAGAGEPSAFIRPLGLSEGEVNDLVAFLRSLTGAPPSSRWTCDNSRARVDGYQPKFGSRCAEVP